MTGFCIRASAILVFEANRKTVWVWEDILGGGDGGEKGEQEKYDAVEMSIAARVAVLGYSDFCLVGCGGDISRRGGLVGLAFD